MKKNVLIGIIILFVIKLSFADSIYISPTGSDKNYGGKDDPIETLQELERRLSKNKNITKIMFYEGTYFGTLTIRNHLPSNGNAPLTIQAIQGQNVVFEGSQKIENYMWHKKHKNILIIKRKSQMLSGRSPKPFMLERRMRFKEVMRFESLIATKNGYYFDKENVYLHVSGHDVNDIYLGLHHVAINIYRPNTRIKNITAKNYITRYRSSGFYCQADHIVIQNCYSYNCSVGYMVGVKSNNSKIISSQSYDCSAGIFSLGQNAEIRSCKLIKKRDSFLNHSIYEQDDSGIQYYYPAKHGKVYGNLIKGFLRPIFIKCKGDFVVEHNTCVDSYRGISRSKWNKENRDIYRNNIIVNCKKPLFAASKLRATTTYENNCFWNIEPIKFFEEDLKHLIYSGAGRNNIYADPLFVDPENMDYRLLPNSPCIMKELTLGALPSLKEIPKDTSPPILNLDINVQDAQPYGQRGVLYFKTDPWLRAGEKEAVRSVVKKDATYDYFSTNDKIRIKLKARDRISKITQMRFKQNKEEWGKVEAFSPVKKLQLNKGNSKHTIYAQVADALENWSKATKIKIMSSFSKLNLLEKPVAISNSNGVVIQFHSSIPCKAIVEYGINGSYKYKAVVTPFVERKWNPNDGGEWQTYWNSTGIEHIVTINQLPKNVKDQIHYRVRLIDDGHKTWISENYQVKLSNKTREIYVSKEGADTLSEGSYKKPYRSIQFAAKVALPGDTIIIADGVYYEPVYFSGGKDGAPITFKAEHKGKTIIDGLKQHEALFRIEKGTHVIIDGLLLQGTLSEGYGIYISHSKEITIKNCTFSNRFYEETWPTGSGIYAHESKYLNIFNNILAHYEWGVHLTSCSDSKIHQNSIYWNLYCGLRLNFSTRNMEIFNNSICFNVSEQIQIYESNREDFHSMICDFNNLATDINMNTRKKKVPTVLETDNYYGNQSKAIVLLYLDGKTKRHDHLNSWVKETGKDKHSIFKDPLWTNRRSLGADIANNSPNLMSGKNNMMIGANFSEK